MTERGTAGRHALAGSPWGTFERVLGCVGFFMGTFIMAANVIFCIKGAVPDTPVAGGAEALPLAGIKVLAGGKGAGKEEECACI